MLKNLSDNLNMLMAKARISSDELARRIGVPATTIKRIRNSEQANPTIATLTPIAHFFSVSLDQLVGLEISACAIKQSIINTQKIPILTWQSCISHEKLNELKHSNTILVEKLLSESAFALIVEDDNLDFFPKKSILIIDPEVRPANGDYIIVANINHNVASIRKYIIEIDQIYLKPLIPGIGISALTSEYKILGVILQYKMELKPETQ